MYRRILSILAVIVILLPYAIIPQTAGAQIYEGYVWLKAGQRNFYNITDTGQNITVGRYNIFRIILDRDAAITDIGPIINVSLVLESDYFRAQVGGYRILGLIRIDQNRSWSSTGGRYNVTLYTDPASGRNYTIIALNMTAFDLSSVPYITNVYYGTVTTRNLYNQKLFAKLWQATAFEAAISNNFVTVVDPNTTASDVKLGIQPGTACGGEGSANYTVVADFSQFLYKIYIASGYTLTISDANLTYIKIYNRFDPADSEELVRIEHGVITYNGSIYINIADGVSTYNATAITAIGEIQDFAPTIPDLTSSEIRSIYDLEAYYNFTIENDTLAVSFLVIATSDTASPITGYSMELTVYAAVELTRNDYTGPINQTNPGDLLSFIVHHMPSYYATLSYMGISNLTIYKIYRSYSVAVDVASFVVPPLYLGDGVGAFAVSVPNGLWDSEEVGYRIYVNDGRYIERLVSCYYLRDHIYPYFHVYTLHNSTIYLHDLGTEFAATFIENSTTAPGDYLMIHGYGFNTSAPFIALLRNVSNTSIIYQIIISDHREFSGEVYALLRVKDIATGLPIPPHDYILYFGTNVSVPYTFSNITVTVGGDLEKILLNPTIFFNGTGYVVNHIKLGERVGLSFNATYPLVTDPDAYGNDTFLPSSWALATQVEAIGFNASTIELEVFNKRYNISYPWISLNLVYGYNITSLYGATIPFLPYGNYTLFFDNETIYSINNDTVFTIYTQIDVDYDSCRAGYFNVTIVGGSPSENLTIEIEYGIVVNDTFSDLGVPLWNGTIILDNITTDIYGYAFKSFNSTLLYPAEYVVNTSYYLLGVYRLNGTGSIVFYYEYYGEVTEVYAGNESLIVDWGHSDYHIELSFFVYVDYNITIRTVDTTPIPRFNVTVTVPHVAMPGDTIPVQVFVHTEDVGGILVIVSKLLHSEFVKSWWMMVKLVRVRDGEVVYYVDGYFHEHPEWYVVAGDLDGDDEDEVYWRVNLEAPLVIGRDEAYRVDLRLIIAYNATPLPPDYVDYNESYCRLDLNISGTIGWTVYDTGYIIDHHEIMVLGLLEMKLDIINDTVAYIRGVVEDTNGVVHNLSRYIHINITDLLLSINTTVASIKNDTVEIRAGITRIETTLDNIIDMLGYISGNISLILSYEESEMAALEEINASLENLTSLVLYLQNDIDDAFDSLVNYTLPMLAEELYENISARINITADSLLTEIMATKSLVNDTRNILLVLAANLSRVEAKVDLINSTLVGYVIPFLHTFYNDVSDNLTVLKDAIVYNITAKLDELNESMNENFEYVISLLIAVNGSVYDLRPLIEAVNASIYAKLEDIQNNFTAQVNALNNTIVIMINSSTSNLTYLINSRTEYLEELINNKTAAIIAELSAKILGAENNVTALINASTNRLCMAIRSTNSTLHAIIENKTSLILSTLAELNASLMTTLDEVKNSVLTELNVTLNNLTLLIRGVNSTLYMKIEDEATGLKTLINYTRAVILAALNSTRTEIEASINASTNRLCMAIRSTNSTLHAIIENKTEYLEALAETLATELNTTLYNAIEEGKNEILLSLNMTSESLEALINTSTASLHAHINASTEYIADLTTMLITDLNTTIMNRLDEMEGYLSFLITYEASYLEGKLYDVADNVTYTLLVAIDNAKSDLGNLITLKADQIRFELNETRMEIIAKLGDVEANIINEIGDLRTYLEGELSSIETTIATIKTNTETIIRNLAALSRSVDMKYDNLTTLINATNETLYQLTVSIGDEVMMTVIGNATNIYNFINSTASFIHGDIAELYNKLLDVNTTLSNALDALSAKLDSVSSSISDNIAKATTTLQDSIKQLKASTSEGFDRTNNSVIMFGAASLLLLAIIIGLTGYGLIRTKG